MVAADLYIARSGILTRPGFTGGPGLPVGRDLLVYGVDKPNATTTGVIGGTTLTVYSETPEATNNYTFPGATTVENKIIYGDLKPPTNGAAVTLKNCLLVGGNHIPSGQSGVVDCNSGRPGTGVMTLIDCTIDPRRPSLNRDCIVGHRYEIFRCDLSKGIDGAGIFITNANGTSAAVKVYGCYIHDLVYFYPDYDNGVSGATVHTDGTHNDGIQIQGGANIHVLGNYMRNTSFLGAGSSANPDKPWLLSGTTKWINGATIIIQKQSVTAALSNVIVEQNWIESGLSGVNMKPGSYTVRENWFHPVAASGSGHSQYFMRGDLRASTNVTGILTNRWEDDNTLLTEPQASGIHWNA